ncbi:MAG: uracil-DNA glycosylase [Treponemataceae bacterium]|nr:uracil-DNA glycosylase [Treponemataceae bacterium]
MTAEEKTTLYTLLKTAATNAYGYVPPAFSGNMPPFADDETAAQSADETRRTESPSQTENTVPSAGSQIAAIAQKIAACDRCVLARTRTNVVPGTGVTNPLVAVIGEGPGYEEDKRGEPFVGPAGQLLDKMLASIGLSRTENCFIANIVKCRPPNNRVPLPEEAAACESFLHAQLFALRPKMILCAGSTAAKNLLKTKNGVTRLRGQFYDWNGIPVAVTFHPSALLRDASQKRFAWEDLKMMRARLQEIAPEYRP